MGPPALEVQQVPPGVPGGDLLISSDLGLSCRLDLCGCVTVVTVFDLQGFPGLKGFPGDPAFYYLEYPGVPVST